MHPEEEGPEGARQPCVPCGSSEGVGAGSQSPGRQERHWLCLLVNREGSSYVESASGPLQDAGSRTQGAKKDLCSTRRSWAET